MLDKKDLEAQCAPPSYRSWTKTGHYHQPQLRGGVFGSEVGWLGFASAAARIASTARWRSITSWKTVMPRSAASAQRAA